MYPAQELKQLNQHCKELIVETENDPTKQLFIVHCLIESQNYFPTSIYLGIKYLEKSKSGNILDSVVYLCQNLIKGEIIPHDLKKVKKYLSKNFSNNNPNISSLYGKILYKRRKYFRMDQVL